MICRTSITLLTLMSAQILATPPIVSSQEFSNTDIGKKFLDGKQAFIDGQFEQALELLAVAHADRPTSSEVLYLIADANFMLGQMPEAVEQYDKIIANRPKLKPQLWQRGLALYYADEFEKGQQQFEVHQTVNSQDVENAVWHMLCLARVPGDARNSAVEKISGVNEARKQFINIRHDSRVPMQQIHELFAGTGDVDAVIDAATRSTGSETRDRYQLYYAHLYVGLYYEMMGEAERSTEAMKKAVELNPLPASSLMGSVARVHLRLRDPENRK